MAKKPKGTGSKGLVGRFIEARRDEIGMSRAQLTRKIGCSDNFIGILERGEAPFPFRRWPQYADALGVSRKKFLRIAAEERFPEIMPYLVPEESE